MTTAARVSERRAPAFENNQIRLETITTTHEGTHLWHDGTKDVTRDFVRLPFLTVTYLPRYSTPLV